jgi:uncharacterized protein YcfL
MKPYYFILVSAFVLIFVSCESKTDVLIADFERFVIKASNKYNNCDDETWRQLMNEFQKIENKSSQLENKLSEQEKEKVAILKGRFYSIQVKYEVKRIKDKLKNEYNKTKGFVDGFIDDH